MWDDCRRDLFRFVRYISIIFNVCKISFGSICQWYGIEIRAKRCRRMSYPRSTKPSPHGGQFCQNATFGPIAEDGGYQEA